MPLGKFKIAQVAPLWTSIPPKGYGGAEKIISLLTDGLVGKNHQVTLFASGDSETKARLVSVSEKAPGLSKEAQLSIVNNMNHVFNMILALEKSEEFDLIHWHLSKDLIPIMLAMKTKSPSVITIHNHFYVHEEMPKLQNIFSHYKDFPNFISISDFHRHFYPFQYLDTVYNGINLSEFDFSETTEDYMAWIGRFEFQKGVHTAIKIALDLNIPLKIAAPKDENDYFKEEIEPYLDNPLIDYIGEVDVLKRNELLKKAKVFINPIQWDEPFGLVVPEANACGTPVVAFSRGAMPELIKEGKNGFIVKADNVEDFKLKIKAIFDMPLPDYGNLRANCRKQVEEKFTAEIMVDNYEKVYQKILNGKKLK